MTTVSSPCNAMLANKGETIPPCGVPSSVGKRVSPSSTPAFSQTRKSLSSRGNVLTFFNSASWLIRSKNNLTEYLPQNPPEPDEIEVVDPAHPLFGRKFRLVSRPQPSPTGPDFVLVAYRDSMLLKLAVLATNLTSVPLSTARTKFTVQALEELLSLVKECESPCCPIPSISGVSCQKRSGKKSSRTSSPSSRR